MSLLFYGIARKTFLYQISTSYSLTKYINVAEWCVQVSKEQCSAGSGTVLTSCISGSEHPASVSSLGTSLLQPLRVDTSVANADPGPPTPTHSEHHDATDVRKGNDSACLNFSLFIFLSFYVTGEVGTL